MMADDVLCLRGGEERGLCCVLCVGEEDRRENLEARHVPSVFTLACHELNEVHDGKRRRKQRRGSLRGFLTYIESD
jgi:hypothetical protein